jgi:hypothetical protein
LMIMRNETAVGACHHASKMRNSTWIYSILRTARVILNHKVAFIAVLVAKECTVLPFAVQSTWIQFLVECQMKNMISNKE